GGWGWRAMRLKRPWPWASTAGPSRKQTPAAAVALVSGATRSAGSGAFAGAGPPACTETRNATGSTATAHRKRHIATSTEKATGRAGAPVLCHRQGAGTSNFLLSFPPAGGTVGRPSATETRPQPLSVEGPAMRRATLSLAALS